MFLPEITEAEFELILIGLGKHRDECGNLRGGVCEQLMNRLRAGYTPAPYARSLADALAKGPCMSVMYQANNVRVSPGERCFDAERKRAIHGHSRPIQFFDPERMCEPCAAAWYAEMTALAVGKIGRHMTEKPR